MLKAIDKKILSDEDFELQASQTVVVVQTRRASRSGPCNGASWLADPKAVPALLGAGKALRLTTEHFFRLICNCN